jgi:hypothetical protein
VLADGALPLQQAACTHNPQIAVDPDTRFTNADSLKDSARTP